MFLTNVVDFKISPKIFKVSVFLSIFYFLLDIFNGDG